MHASYNPQLQAELRNGYSAERLLGMDVAGTNGESLGEVQNIPLSKDGQARAIVISAGGVLGVGETTYRVPWNQVRLDMRQDRLFVPLLANNVDRFRWGAERDRARATELHATPSTTMRTVSTDPPFEGRRTATALQSRSMTTQD